MAWLCLASALAFGCAERRDPNATPDVRAGEDTCAQCEMIVSELRFAAAGVRADGSVAAFDDIGDLLVYLGGNHEPFVTTWVHDFAGKDWLRSESAFFVSSEKINTPMGGGLVALAGRAGAEALAAKTAGTILDFKQLRSTGKEETK